MVGVDLLIDLDRLGKQLRALLTAEAGADLFAVAEVG
jgi:hypothetical protein